jgi:hypothetical protein
MSRQLDMDFEVRAPVRRVDGDAARDGATAIQCRLRGLRLRAFDTFARAGDHGATNEDVYSDSPGVREHSIRPRVAELAEAGLIEECGRRRGSYGVDITVWKLTALGRSVVAAWARGEAAAREVRAAGPGGKSCPK